MRTSVQFLQSAKNSKSDNLLNVCVYIYLKTYYMYWNPSVTSKWDVIKARTQLCLFCVVQSEHNYDLILQLMPVQTSTEVQVECRQTFGLYKEETV